MYYRSKKYIPDQCTQKAPLLPEFEPTLKCTEVGRNNLCMQIGHTQVNLFHFLCNGLN